METDSKEGIAVETVVEPTAGPDVEKVAEAPTISDLASFLKRARAVVPLAVVGLFVLGLVAFLYFAKPFVMPIVLATLLSFLLKPIVRALNHLRIPEALGA